MSSRALVVLPLLAAPSGAQAPATVSSFGVGCPGSATGFGAPDVVPQVGASQFGNTSNVFPFAAGSMRYQQVFRGSELGSVPIYFGVGLRQDDGFVNKEGDVIDMEIALGGTTFDERTIGASYDANFNAASTPKSTVFARRRFALPMMPSAKPTQPSTFFLTIPFDTPWVRTLASGENLLIEVVVYDNGQGSKLFTYPFDAVDNGTTTRLYGPASATVGSVDRNFGVVMAFFTPAAPQPLSLTASGPPHLGATWFAELLHAGASAPGVMIAGTSHTSAAGVSLPFALGAVGAPGCSLLVSTDLTLPVMANVGGDLVSTVPVPNNPFLAKVPLFLQYAMLDAANALGIVTSNGEALNIGR